jgi:hypothetical protein
VKYFIAHTLEPISLFLFFCALLFWSRKDKRGIIKVLIGFYLLSGLLILKIMTVKSGTSATNIHLYSLSCLLKAFGICAFFFNVLKRKWQRGAAIVGCVINGAYYIFNNIIRETPGVFDSLAYVILSSTIVMLIFMFMHQLLNEVTEEPLSLNFDFWFVSSQLFYFLGAFAIFLTYGYLTNRVISSTVRTNTTLTWLWGFHNVLLFLSAIITSASIAWIFYRNKSRLS